MARKRVYAADQAHTLVADSARWRSAVVQRMAGAPIDSAYYKALGGLLDALDDLAEAVTGNRRLHHQRSATTPGPTLAQQEEQRRREAGQAD